MTEEQIDKAFRVILGVRARAADVQVVEMLGGTVEVCAEYIWDHWMGEPDKPTAEEVEEQIKEAIA